VKFLAALLLLPALFLAGNPVTCELIGTYDVARLNKVLTTELAEFSDYPAKILTATNAVRLYRIVYPSVVPEQNNRPTKASGLLAIPDGAETTAIAVEGKLATHRGTFVHAVAEQAKWFDELILAPKK